jgi:hypothetical protein
MVIRIEFELIRFEAYLIKEWIESLKVHLINILLLNAFSHYRLISKAYGS